MSWAVVMGALGAAALTAKSARAADGVVITLAASSSLASNPAQAAKPVPAAVLDGRMVACQAACHWTPAQALRARGRTVSEAYGREDKCSQQAGRSIATFLNLQACHQEDLAAASGLKAYYTRIAVAEQRRLGAESKEWLSAAATQLQAVRRSGLNTSTDPSGFERRALEIDDQELQLRAQDQQLRSALTQLAHCNYAMEEVAQEDLVVQPTQLDCPALVCVALRDRYDIRSWRYLASQLSESSAPAFGQLLSTTVGSFGLPLPVTSGLKRFLLRPDHASLADNLQQELQLILEALSGAIRQSVEEKCVRLELAYARLELAGQMVASWQKRREQLQQLQELGKPDPEQTATAQAGWIKARADEIARRLDARLAEIELAETTGQLAQRCCHGQAWLLTGLAEVP